MAGESNEILTLHPDDTVLVQSVNTMSYYANLEDVQTYIMNYVMASKSVLVVYGATSISEVGH